MGKKHGTLTKAGKVTTIYNVIDEYNRLEKKHQK